jgi:DNA (cytosine-5)-methyltransferase 1
MSTITTQDHHALVTAFLVAYYGNERDGGRLSDPMRTLTTKERFGLVTVRGEEYRIADIGMRMLQPRELYLAQGFPPDYIIDRGADGMPFTKTAQVRMCGNSVSPPIAAAIVRANLSDIEQQEAA